MQDSPSAGNSRPLSPGGLAVSAEADQRDAIAEYFSKAESLIEENSDWDEEEEPGLRIASLASGLCYDVRMRYHCEVRPTAEVHPEDPRRIYYIYKELCRAGLVDDPDSLRPLAPKPLKRINAREATKDEVELVHGDGHFSFMESTKGMYHLYIFISCVRWL